MLKEKAGVIAGQIWEALNETEGKTQKQLKKEAKLKADKDLFLGLGWLLRVRWLEIFSGQRTFFLWCSGVIASFGRIFTLRT